MYKKVSLSRLTWLKAGGSANMFKADTVNNLQKFVKEHKQYFTIGAGSNLLVRDRGISRDVVKLGRAFNYVTYNDEIITAGGATLAPNIAKYALDNSLGGLEFMIGIPGTVGGLVSMNAGCYDNDISQVLVEATCINDMGEIIILKTHDIDFGYRTSRLPASFIIIEAKFKVSKGSQTVQQEITKIMQNRIKSQPINEKTCGCIFRNSSNQSAWKLIDQAGCRGLTIGGAKISEKHSNFLINDNNASATDLENLCNTVQLKVFEKTGIMLEREIIIVGIE
ncbi:MAG: UDP-N-acetylenolpyruvoylglucosamine reductase [Candidatus Xenolissoclinum pacificiensis L6]|uniref:UDP-N-acetylenolpyruvoylglucosamine reductase n=1 Tax=Candidatus Xenolissoclinum pacificiensis L6 TaxID=1401685 RepID=W2V111_9RICK|nr:MAG: UDP-N-acetylenolpyruvoylglucosamine reductase [Candidatus Xenolissoclinum pacificiensis L6]